MVRHTHALTYAIRRYPLITLTAFGIANGAGAPLGGENRAGDGTSTGAAFVAGAPPDGYTLLVMSASITVNPSLYPNVNLDPLKSFEPIALIATATQLLVVPQGIGVADVRQFLDFARR